MPRRWETYERWVLLGEERLETVDRLVATLDGAVLLGDVVPRLDGRDDHPKNASRRLPRPFSRRFRPSVETPGGTDGIRCGDCGNSSTCWSEGWACDEDGRIPRGPALVAPWLEFEVVAGGPSTTMQQTAIFDPVGWFGRLYWYALFPLHQLVFAGMLRGIASEALPVSPGVDEA